MQVRYHFDKKRKKKNNNTKPAETEGTGCASDLLRTNPAAPPLTGSSEYD